MTRIARIFTDQNRSASYQYFLKALIYLSIVILVPSISSGNWQNYGGDLVHSGYSESSLIPLELRWKYQAGNTEISAPIIDRGILFVGSDNNYLYALDAVKGELKWQYSTLGKVYTPAAKNGIVFAASFDNNIYAIDYDGNLKWQSNMGSSMASPPIVYNNNLYGGSNGEIYALYIINGSVNWKYTTSEWVESSPAISQGIVFTGSNDDNLYALDAINKRLIWKYTAGGNIASSPAIFNGIVFAGANDNHIYAIDSNSGVLKWRKRTNDIVRSSPAVFQNVVYVGSNDNTIYALNSENGDIIWEFRTNGWVDSQPLVTRDIVYAGSKDGSIYALDRDKGTLINSYEIGSGIISLAISDNLLYATSTNGYVYAFGTESAKKTDSKDIADLTLPELRVNSLPLNVTSETLFVSGTAKDSSGILTVTVNGIETGAENWNVSLRLSKGVNIISIMAVDKAGNIRSDIRKVNYIPSEMEETPLPKIPGFSINFGIISFLASILLIKFIKYVRS